MPPPCPPTSGVTASARLRRRGALLLLPFSDASLRMACAEQTSMQAVQPICSLRLCAQSFGL
jgi:hypothetical protein